MGAPAVNVLGPNGPRSVGVIARDVEGLARAAGTIAKSAFSEGSAAVWFDLDPVSSSRLSRRVIIRPGRPLLSVSVPTEELALVGDRVILPGGNRIATVVGLTFETYGALTTNVTLVESILDGRVRDNSIPGSVHALPSAITANVVRSDGTAEVIDVTDAFLDAPRNGIVDRLPGQPGRGLNGLLPGVEDCLEVEVAASMAAYFGLMPEPTLQGLSCPEIPAQRLEQSRHLWSSAMAANPGAA